MDEKEFLEHLLSETESEYIKVAKDKQFDIYKKEAEKRLGIKFTDDQCKQFRVWYDKIVKSPFKQK